MHDGYDRVEVDKDEHDWHVGVSTFGFGVWRTTGVLSYRFYALEYTLLQSNLSYNNSCLTFTTFIVEALHALAHIAL